MPIAKNQFRTCAQIDWSTSFTSGSGIEGSIINVVRRGGAWERLYNKRTRAGIYLGMRKGEQNGTNVPHIDRMARFKKGDHDYELSKGDALLITYGYTEFYRPKSHWSRDQFLAQAHKKGKI